jgi:hypothetical protein
MAALMNDKVDVLGDVDLALLQPLPAEVLKDGPAWGGIDIAIGLEAGQADNVVQRRVLYRRVANNRSGT